MKKSDLDMFSNEASNMNLKFKQQLRSQLVAKSKGKSVKRKGARWPAFVLIPAMAAVAVALLIGFNVTQPNDIKHPLKPSTVSAAVLMQKAAAFKKDFDYSKYNYYEETSKIVYGPKTDICSPGSKTTATEPVIDQTYLYVSSDSNVEAYFGKRLSGYPITPVSIYDETEAQAIPSYIRPKPGSITDFLYVAVDENNPSVKTEEFQVVDKQGRPITGNDVPLTMQGGREVYQFYIKANPELRAPGNMAAGCGAGDITSIALDAKTYSLVTYAVYDGSPEPGNLEFESTSSMTYRNLSTDEALQRMAKAGFDKAGALPAFPGPKAP